MDTLVDAPASQSEPSRTARRWARFRVRTLMLLPLLCAPLFWLYVQAVRASVGGRLSDIKIFIPLDITAVDDATDRPIPAARVDLPSLRPAWLGHPDMIEGDLRQQGLPGIASQPDAITGDDGIPMPRLGMSGMKGRRLGHAFFGLVPVIGEPEILLHPTCGIRVAADGYETWTAFVDDVVKESGRPLVNFAPLPIKVRLKRSPIRPPSKRR